MLKHNKRKKTFLERKMKLSEKNYFLMRHGSLYWKKQNDKIYKVDEMKCESEYNIQLTVCSTQLTYRM